MSIIPAVTGVSVPERFAIPEPQKKRTCTGESLLTSLFTFLLISIRLNRRSGRIYELNAKVERAD